MPQKTYHIVHSPDGGWAVKKSGALRAARVFGTKDEALAWGKNISKKHNSVIVVHRKDGSVQKKEILVDVDGRLPNRS
jgi:hypothetical protein